ncbi:MAG: hypothetical protein EBU90_26220 [Proteobacteria bacterium]|nr:hypothetical protein [Pseudomonadota bacterium]
MTKIERYADKHNIMIDFWTDFENDELDLVSQLVIIKTSQRYATVLISKRIKPMEYDMVDNFLKRNYLPLKILVDRAVRKSCAWKLEYNKINLI